MDIYIWGMIAVLALFNVIALIRMSQIKKASAMEDIVLNERLQKLENQFSALLDGAVGMGDQLQRAQGELKVVRQHQDRLEQKDLGNMPYNQAVRLAAQGADADDLVSQCGLSHDEADLVVMLHKKAPPILQKKAG